MSKKTVYSDLKLINYYTAKIVEVMGWVMTIPLVTALIFEEWNTAIDFGIGMAVSFAFGFALEILCHDHEKEMDWFHGMFIAAYAWIVLTIIDAIPGYLSGHYLSFLDAVFDVMSGFTTTGLVLIQRMYDLSIGMNMWRALITFVGGQGMIVLSLSFIIGMRGGYMMYVGEGKSEKLLPSVTKTARAIWDISLIYLAVGTSALFLAGLVIGLNPVSALLNGIWIFMSAWSTGGFAPHSQNILYYHSMLYMLITMVIFIIGSFNFALHYAVMNKNKKEIYKNIETQSFFITVLITFTIVAIGLIRNNVYPNAVILFTKGFYQLISAHTTTGFMNIYPSQFGSWGTLAMVGITIAMLIGGSTSSTAGGIKGMRIGIIFKSFVFETKKLFMSPKSVKVEKFHNQEDIDLDNEIVKNVMIITMMYILSFVIGLIITLIYRYPIEKAAFEVASALGNVGLSRGITAPSMPDLLKVLFIILMWVGRLEFMAVIAFVAYPFMGAKRK